MRRIAILMTVHNRCEKTIRCLDNLYANTIPDGCSFEVFLTDDGCTDMTAESIRAYYPQVYIIQGDGNLYWNRGMWSAWEEAAKEGFDYYLWLNDDTFLYPCAIEELISESIVNENKSIIVGATENTEKTAITYGGYVNGKVQLPQGKVHEVEYFNGNVVLVPQYVYERLGNLDYYFRHSKGDFDYGMRAKKLGIKMLLVGRALGICEKNINTNGWNNPALPLSKRWKALKMANGMPPHEIFYLNKKHIGMISAITHYFLIYLRCLFPQLWLRLKKK